MTVFKCICLFSKETMKGETKTKLSKEERKNCRDEEEGKISINVILTCNHANIFIIKARKIILQKLKKKVNTAVCQK